MILEVPKLAWQIVPAAPTRQRDKTSVEIEV